MDLLKKEIQTSVVKSMKNVQITLDKDMNVPDSKPDIEKIVQNRGELRLEEIEVLNDKIRIKGTLLYRGLYLTGESGPLLNSLSYPFELEEYINVDGMEPMDSTKVTAELDDLNVILINSRKLGIRALITFHLAVNEIRRVEGAVEEKEEGIQQLHHQLSLTQLAFHKRDTNRIKGEMTLAASKPNIRELIWDQVSLRNPDIRLMDGKVNIRGDLLIFLLYLGEEEHVPVQYLEWELPFSSELLCGECKEEMVGNIHISVGSRQIEVKPDSDGEERVLELEVILDLDMKGYQEESVEFLSDLYSAQKELIPSYSPFYYENLIVKNNAKTKVQKRFRMDGAKGRILQLIHVDGSVKVDEMELREDGIYVEGVVLADLLTITGDDMNPLYGITQVLPFSYLVEAKNLKAGDNYEMEAMLDQIHGMMIDGDEVEIKAVISLNTIAFSMKEGKVITDVEEKPYDYKKRKDIPGIAGYIVGKEDTLWNIAKNYCSTIDEIKKMNHLKDGELKEGQRLLIVKKVKEIL
ncbi:MAG: DUF3794 domain-containing protein [Lachnospiraceae bacterium]|nr:DUF3794 domain-containing protein [Lachnospiraceae bacterium]